MLEEILGYLNNWFPVTGGIHTGVYMIQKGSLELPFLAEGQYFRVIGSIFNDGLYKYPAAELVDESFEGSVWALAVPPAVIALSEEIAEWREKYGDAANSPYASESFGGYSYTKATGSGSGSGSGGAGWQSAFRDRLNRFRRIGGI